jgi:hypothetical protein
LIPKDIAESIVNPSGADKTFDLKEALVYPLKHQLDIESKPYGQSNTLFA